jgi:hypothetical protein
MSVSTYEQETVINYARQDGCATIWRSDTTVMTKLDRLVRESPENWRLQEEAHDKSGELISKTYRLQDKGLISFRKARVVLSEEAREARARQLGKFPQ